eukprot:2962908-Prymnesium_polylepis.4
MDEVAAESQQRRRRPVLLQLFLGAVPPRVLVPACESTARTIESILEKGLRRLCLAPLIDTPAGVVATVVLLTSMHTPHPPEQVASILQECVASMD